MHLRGRCILLLGGVLQMSLNFGWFTVLFKSCFLIDLVSGCSS